MESKPPFKVLVVGAGVAGLVLAHCLDKAGIDYVVIDKGIIAPDFGTTITIQPHSCRLFHQLGLLDDLLNATSPMYGAHCRAPDGKSFADGPLFHRITNLTGYEHRTLFRKTLLRLLYDRLPDQSKVYEHARVTDIQHVHDLVKVILDDGREFVGDLVVGADGVHSKVRELMWERANLQQPGYIPSKEKKAMTTTYKAIVAACDPVAGIGKQDMEVVSNDKYSFLLLCQPDWITYIVHYKLPKEEWTSSPIRKKYTQDDMEAMAKELATRPINDSVLFGELWQRTFKAQMISLEEGVLDHWYYDRMVLVGDSVHKTTPNAAIGGNTAIETCVTLTNTLRELLQGHPNKKPTPIELREALQGYQNIRKPRVQSLFKMAGDITRLQAYDGWMNYIVQRWLTPVLGLDGMAKNLAEVFTGGQKLSFVPFEQRHGPVAWKDSIVEVVGGGMKDWSGLQNATCAYALPLAFTYIGLFSLVVWAKCARDPGQALMGFKVSPIGNQTWY